MIESRCGIVCSECGYKEQVGCPGCVNMSKPFWGDACPVKTCCETKEKAHCGGCSDFACKQLNDFAFDKEHGDNGKRIEQCRQWTLEDIITKFSESGWDVIETASKAWLAVKNERTRAELIEAIKAADGQCGSCGCEFDALYKTALSLLQKRGA